MMRRRLARRAQDGANPLAVLRMAMRDHEARIAELERRVGTIEQLKADLAAVKDLLRLVIETQNAQPREPAGHPILDLAEED